MAWRTVLAAVLCLGTIAPCLGFGISGGLLSAVRPQLARGGSGACGGLRMKFDDAAAEAALERGRKREAALAEKRKAREAREREARSRDRYAMPASPAGARVRSSSSARGILTVRADASALSLRTTAAAT